MIQNAQRCNMRLAHCREIQTSSLRERAIMWSCVRRTGRPWILPYREVLVTTSTAAPNSVKSQNEPLCTERTLSDESRITTCRRGVRCRSGVVLEHKPLARHLRIGQFDTCALAPKRGPCFDSPRTSCAEMPAAADMSCKVRSGARARVRALTLAQPRSL